MIPLIKDTINKNDVDRLIEWLKTYPRLTMGKLTREYESQWAQKIGSKYSVFVNSGSSANLMMIYCLLEMGYIKTGDKVVLPAVSWSTDLAPLIQLGLKPVLCDCNMEDLSIDLEHFKQIVKKDKPRVLLLVSVLGMVPDMDTICSICDENDIILLEDSCESLGSKYKDKDIGTFGLMSSFSTYFGHHISTIEGGMICTDDRKVYNVLKGIRSHGWDRDMDPDIQQELRDKYHIENEFDALYRFYHFGFNLRGTDLQSFLGIDQLSKLDDVVQKRNRNYNLYNKLIKSSSWKPQSSSDDVYISNFAYPIINEKRDRIVEELIKNKIETRPLICGSIGRQPFWIKRYGLSNLKNADLVHDCGLYLPNNHEITEEEIVFVCDIVNSCID